VTVCLTPFQIKDPCQLTPLFLNLRYLIFGLNPFGWLHIRALSAVYESKGAEYNQGGCALTANYVQSPFAWRLVHSAWFICVYVNPFLIYLRTP